MASSSAILTDAFPANQRGMALGVNMVAAVAGSFLGLLIGGFLSEWHWKAIFWVGVPIGILGTIWSIRSLKELGVRTPGRLDWAGTLSFGIGLTVLLTGITYGIQPYGDSTTGWTNPWVLRFIRAAVAAAFSPRTAHRFADGRHQAVPVRLVRHGQSGRADVLDGPRRPPVHAHHLAAGHLASLARLQL
jgi:MFS family permease